MTGETVKTLVKPLKPSYLNLDIEVELLSYGKDLFKDNNQSSEESTFYGRAVRYGQYFTFCLSLYLNCKLDFRL